MKSKQEVSKLLFTINFCVITFICIGQNDQQEINKINLPKVALAPLRFLASDELMGRGTTRPEINIAARYISEEFRSIGLNELTTAPDYFQTFSLNLFTPSKTGTFEVNNTTYKLGENLIQMSGTDISIRAPVVYVSFGMEENLDKVDVKGKIVVEKWGANDSSSLIDGFLLLDNKRKLAQQRGATALIESLPHEIPWEEVQEFYLQEHTQEEGNNISTFLIEDKDFSLFKLTPNSDGALSITGTHHRNISTKNVIGWIEGTNPKMKNQYVVLSAHYDHLGVASHPKLEEGKLDSIFNGARDNAIGTTAVIDAARYFVRHPQRDQYFL